METKIYYFSGTGNTYAAALQLKRLLGTNRIEKITPNLTEMVADTVIILSPTYAYGLPSLVFNSLKSVHIKADYLAFITTCGTAPGGIGFQVHKILKKKGIVLTYYQKIKTVENYFAIFKPSSKEEQSKMLAHQYDMVNNIFIDITNRVSTKRPSKRLIGRLINFVFRRGLPFISRFMVIDKTCNACQICVKYCLSNAITIQDNQARINHKLCQNCLSCINRCPKKAIAFLRIKKTTARYLHPDDQIS